MNKTRQRQWIFNKKVQDSFASYETKQKFKYIKGSLIAIVLGLILAGIIIAAQNVNPFIYLGKLFEISFNGLFIEQTMQWFAIYIIVALAVAVGFKSGMFNIGVSGQMLLGASLSIIYYKLVVVDQKMAMNGGHVFVIFLICIFSGAFLAGIAGLLKALFNIHEVVTTIMLNWTVWYTFKWAFSKPNLEGAGISTSASMAPDQLAINGSSIAVPLIIAFACLIIVAILLSKTVFGYKLKAVGSSIDASKYAGFDVRGKMVGAMLISGALAGIASFVNVLTLNPNIAFTLDNLPAVGYDAIAISLVAFNNPIGILFTSFLWSIFQSGGAGAASLFDMPNQTSNLIFGIIVYFAAISVVFMNYYPILRLRMKIALFDSKPNRFKIKEIHEQQVELNKKARHWKTSEEVINFKQEIALKKDEVYKKYMTLDATKENKVSMHQEINALTLAEKRFNKDYRENLKQTHKKFDNEIKNIKRDTYVERLNSAKLGINHRQDQEIKKTNHLALNQINLNKSSFLNQKEELSNKLSLHNHWKLHQFKLITKNYKKEKRELKVLYEGKIGDLTHYFIYMNGRTDSRGDLKKHTFETQTRIESLRIDYHSLLNAVRKDQSLSKTEGQERINDLKKQRNQEIEELKNLDCEYQKKVKNHLQELKADYYQTTMLVKSDGSLAKVKQELQTKLKAMDADLQTEKAFIRKENDERKVMFEKQTSKSDLLLMNELKKDYLFKKKKIHKDAIYESLKLSEMKASFFKLKTELEFNELLVFKNYDSHQSAKKKAKVYHWILRETFVLQNAEIINEANFKTTKIKEETKEMLSDYNEIIKSFNMTYKFKRKDLRQNKELDHALRELLLVHAQEEYSLSLEEYIQELEVSIRHLPESEVS